jgi:ATP-dependent exoDNAse (exonuclease V) beta subunit
VILADLTAKGTPEEPWRWVDPTRQLCAMRLAGAAPPDLVDHAHEERQREEEEAVRLLYVAATRARDLLVVPAVGDQPQPESWLAPLDPAVYPPPDTVRMPETRAPEGCPVLAGDCVSERPDDVVQPPLAVTPGLHRPQAGTHRVVWWAPSALELSVLETVGLKQQKLLAIDESGERSESGIRTHAAWQAARATVRADAAAPSIRVVTATEHAQVAIDGAVDVAIERVERAADRPSGRRFGTLVHATLAAVDLGATRNDVQAVAAIEARLVGATPDEVAAAVDAVAGALAHPLLRRAAGSSRVARETPLAIGIDDDTLVEGVVDVAFEEPGGWTVIDFKTDVELAGRRHEYARQVSLYARALAAATGKPARPVLLQV